MISYIFVSPCVLETWSSTDVASAVLDAIYVVIPSTYVSFHADLSFGKMLTSAPATHGDNLAARKVDLRETETRKGAPTRPSGIHSRRNHTIGLGELEQLDLMVTETVIRWASCTNLSSAASLRSSLVC